MAQSAHYSVRGQQRGLPPFVGMLLDAYGCQQYDGRGAIIRYFNKKSRRQMEHDMGREPIRRIAEWLDAFKVESCEDGSTVTIGHRYKRIIRK